MLYPHVSTMGTANTEYKFLTEGNETHESSNKFEKTNLSQLSKEELVEIIIRLQNHNQQLKNIINKGSETQRKEIKKSKPFDFTRCKFRHVLLKFLYLGWDYQGYASQEDTINTVEHYIFEALQKTCLIKNRSSSNYHRCGRTDKGVSSFGQTISIDLRSNAVDTDGISNEISYCKILNKVLPDKIRCITWSPAPEKFSARFDCTSRIYKYYFVKGNLDIEKMKEAAQYLIGSHDFRNFCKMDVANGVVNFVRNIFNVDIIPFESNCEGELNEYSLYTLKIKGNAFLWHQIRCIIAVLFLVGQGNENAEVVKELLDINKNPRKPEYNMAAEVPLNLFHCNYDDSLSWVYDLSSVEELYKHIYELWAGNYIKASMIKDMLLSISELPINNKDQLKKQANVDFLLNGAKRKKYKPLLSRQKCESLENRIQHFSKKRKL